ncbi:MAG: LysM peptidoglycan-binding domain-containing protein [Bacteroidota bacterium]
MKKSIALLCLALFALVFQGFGQEYTTHTVAEGETLQSISRQYRVTPYRILQANKEIKTAADVKANMILIIPTQGPLETKTEPTEEELQEEKPIGYTRHRVRKRETLFGITKQYEITEEQLKRYNRQLYAEPLKKGMVLQIPKYAKPDPNEERDLDFDMYTVAPKETRWSIAHKFNISVDSLVKLNPELSSSVDYLATGQSLKVPRPKGDSLKEQKVDLFVSYTVPPKKTLYSLGKEYGIPSDSIVKLNPEIMELGGLKEGMVIRLPKEKLDAGTVNTDNFIFYEVKPKQNIFRLTQNLNITREELFALNPALENGLKAGMVLKLPKNKSTGLQVKNALILDKVNLVDSINVDNTLNVVYMLPFRLDRINLNDTKKTNNQIATRNDIGLSLGFYSGAMVALDSLKKMGISVNVKAIDTDLNEAKVAQFVNTYDFGEVGAVIGPVNPKALDIVALKTATVGIPVVSPTASNSDLGHSNVFYSVPNDDVLRNKILAHMKAKYQDQNVIIIADAEHQKAYDSIITVFPAAQIAKIIKDKSLHLVEFQRQLSKTKDNWVFLETSQPSLISSVSSILNSSNTEDMKVKMITTSYGNAFETESVSKTHLSNLRFTYPSFYRLPNESAFTKQYESRYGFAPNRYAARGFDMTMDVLLKLAHKNNLFETSKIIGETEYSGSCFDYHKDWSSGYHNRAVYLMEYDSLQIKQIKSDDVASNL